MPVSPAERKPNSPGSSDSPGYDETRQTTQRGAAPTSSTLSSSATGGAGKAAVPSTDPAVDIDAYRMMLKIRRFEEKAGQLYGMGYIAGFCHLYIGQEAVAAGLARARKPGDRTIAAYRNHGHLLACGADVPAVMAELCGRASGLSAGKAGSVHLFWPDGGFYGGHGIVGANAPLGVGLALADQYNGSDAVTWCVIGDAAVDQGQVSEAFLIAAEQRLPIVFVIENNAPVSTADVQSDGRKPLFSRGEAFGITGEAVDGMDIDAVTAAARQACADVRDGGGPRILECVTDRYRGHSMSDPGKYGGGDGPTRSQSAAFDPIARVRDRLLRNGVDEEALRDVDQVVRDEVNAATSFAQADGEPSPDQLVSDIRAKGRAGLTAYRRVHGEPSDVSNHESGGGR